MRRRPLRTIAIASIVLLASVGIDCPTIAQDAADGPYDLVILNGRIVDGSGNAWYRGDLAVKGDTIARITPAGLLEDVPSKRKVDASGLVVAPGFIDIQGHSREQLLEGDGRLVGKVTQGVTTEILGEGESNAPSKRFTARTASTPGSRR